MHRVPVSSRAIRSVGYDPKSRTLELEYVGGRRYGYVAVPPKIYRDLMSAPSIGAFVNRRIKPFFEVRRG
jgi:hypothetical protein